MTTIYDLIDESVLHDKIAHAPSTPELLADLTAQCDDSVENNDVTEFWGTTDDGEEWRVHLDGVVAPNTVHCDCGEWSGTRCEWTGPKADTVLVEYMPEQHRASHEAGGNRGVYPANGARRIRVERSCADGIVECDGEWCSVVEEVRP